MGGNAYGLGLFEHATLPPAEAGLVEKLDLGNAADVSANYRKLNDIFKRLGMLIRYSRQGAPFYLIPRQYLAHFLVEVRARADEIIAFLSGLMARRLKETLRVGLVSIESELLLPELSSRMPHLEFVVLDSLEAVTHPPAYLEALVLVAEPRQPLRRLFAPGRGGRARRPALPGGPGLLRGQPFAPAFRRGRRAAHSGRPAPGLHPRHHGGALQEPAGLQALPHVQPRLPHPPPLPERRGAGHGGQPLRLLLLPQRPGGLSRDGGGPAGGAQPGLPGAGADRPPGPPGPAPAPGQRGPPPGSDGAAGSGPSSPPSA